MKFYLSAILVLFYFNAISQKTIKITHEVPNSSLEISYEVLKDDTAIKKGIYKYEGPRFLTKGFYKNNKRDSVWESRAFGKLSSKGKFSDGKRCGVWEFYSGNGELETKYDFDNNSIIFHKANSAKDTIKYAVIIGNDTLLTTLSQPPMYGGGEMIFWGLLVSVIRYPAQAKENGTIGKVAVGITINEVGKVTNYRVIKYVRDGLAEESLRVVKLLDDYWIPAYVNGKAVTSELSIPVNYSLGN